MYDLEIKPSVDKIFKKLIKKNQKQLESIYKKIQEIRNHPNQHYKHLRKPLQDFYEVNINSHFVLIFTIDHAKKVVEIYYFDHHDTVYKFKK